MEKSKLINKVDSTTAEIYMYGVIGSCLDIDANVVVAEIENLRKKGCRNFRFYVNSEGGEVIQGSALFNYLDRTDIEVEWVVDGVAASMMAMLISNPKHKVKAAKYASFMYHRVQGSCYGNSDEVRNLAAMIDTFEKSLVDMMASRMKVDAASVKKEFFTDGLDHWMNAEEAMRRGLVDEIISGKNITSPKELLSSKDVFNFYNKQLINYKQNQKSMITNKAEIGKLLNIAEAEVNDDSVMTAVKNVLKSNSELQSHPGQANCGEPHANLKNQIGELNKAKVKSLIDKAIAEKKFGEDERDSYTRLANMDFELAETMIGKMKGVERIVDRLDTVSEEPEEEKGWTYDDYYKKGKLENLKKTNREKFNRLYKVKFGRNPQD